MKAFLITSALVLCTLTIFSQDASKSSKSDTLTLLGIIHQKYFVDKGGKESDVLDYWFKTNNEDYFIKLYESKISSETLSMFIGKTVKLKFMIKTGEWDSTGKELVPVQSRIGQYIIVLKLIED